MASETPNNSDNLVRAMGELRHTLNKVIDTTTLGFEAISNNFEQMDKNFTHVIHRLENLETRASRIEAKLDIIKSDTELIPDIFSLLEEDGRDIGKLARKLKSLTKQP